jgi:histone H3/H4
MSSESMMFCVILSKTRFLDSVTYTEDAQKKTITALDAAYALKYQAKTLDDFEISSVS